MPDKVLEALGKLLEVSEAEAGDGEGARPRRSATGSEDLVMEGSDGASDGAGDSGDGDVKVSRRSVCVFASVVVNSSFCALLGEIVDNVQLVEVSPT